MSAWDKAQARRRGPRIRERTLLGLALLGGSPGLAASLFILRHKTRKTGFLVRLFLVIFIQVTTLLIYARA